MGKEPHRGLGTGETFLGTAVIKECSDAFQRHGPSYYNSIKLSLGLAIIRVEDIFLSFFLSRVEGRCKWEKYIQSF